MRVKILAGALATQLGVELHAETDVQPDARAKEFVRLGWAVPVVAKKKRTATKKKPEAEKRGG